MAGFFGRRKENGLQSEGASKGQEPTRVLVGDSLVLSPGTIVEVQAVYGSDSKHLAPIMILDSVFLEERRTVTQIALSSQDAQEGVACYLLEPDKVVANQKNRDQVLAMERAVVAQEFIQGYGRLRKAVDGAPAGTVTMGNIIELRLVTGVPHLS